MNNFSEQLGIEELLLPFPGNPSSGIDPRLDFSPSAPYRVLRMARSTARAAERAADADPNADGTPPAEWRTVRVVAEKILAEIGKDLEVAAWMTEALVRSNGLHGMLMGTHLITELARRFWSEGLYPAPEEAGFVDRISPVEGLSGSSGDGTIVQTVRRTTLFARPDGTPVPLYKLKESIKLAGETDKAKVAQRVAAGAIPFADLEHDAKAAGGEHFARLRDQARACLRSLDLMAETLDSLTAGEGPSIARLRTVLDDILDFAQRFASPEAAGIAAQFNESKAAPDRIVVNDGDVQAATLSQPSHESREDMLRELSRIAEYFRRTEPNSPLAGTLDEAVRRARLSFADLLDELMPDAAARAHILAQLGMRTSKS